jgi:hypothetical protein
MQIKFGIDNIKLPFKRELFEFWNYRAEDSTHTKTFRTIGIMIKSLYISINFNFRSRNDRGR